MFKCEALKNQLETLRKVVLFSGLFFFAGCSNGLNLLGGGSSNDSAQSPSYSEGTVTVNTSGSVNISNSSLELTGSCSSDFGNVSIYCPSAIEPQVVSPCSEDQTYSAVCAYASGINFLSEQIRVSQDKLFAVDRVINVDTQAPVGVVIDTLSDIKSGVYVSAGGSFPALKSLMVFCEAGAVVTARPQVGGPTADLDQEAPCVAGLARFDFSFFAEGTGQMTVFQTDQAGNASSSLLINYELVERALENINLTPTRINLAQPNLSISGNCTENSESITISCSNATVVPPAFLCPSGGSFTQVCEYDVNGSNLDFVTQVTVTQNLQPAQNFELSVDFVAPSPVSIGSSSQIQENIVLESNGVYPIAANLSVECESEAAVTAVVQNPSVLNTVQTPVTQTRTCVAGTTNFNFSFSGEGYPQIVLRQTDLAGNVSLDEAVDNFYIANRVLGNIVLNPAAVNSANVVLTVTGTCSVGNDRVRITCPGSTTGSTAQESDCIESGALKDTFTDTCTYAQSLDLDETITIVQGERTLTSVLDVDTTPPVNLVVRGDQDGKGIFTDTLPQNFTFTLDCETGTSLNFTIDSGDVDASSLPSECLGPDQPITLIVNTAGTVMYTGTQTDSAGNTSSPVQFQFIVEESPVVSGALFTGLGASCGAKYIEKSDCPSGNVSYRGQSYGRKKVGESCWLIRNIEEAPTSFRVSPDWDENSNNGAHGEHTDTPAITNDGRFYTYAAAMNDATCVGLDGCDRERGKGVCPTGWHIPSDCEWKAYESAVGMTVTDQEAEGERLSGSVGQVMQSSSGLGISMPLAGFRNPNGVYGGRGTSVRIWTSSETAAASMMTRAVRDITDSVGSYRSPAAKSGAAVVRCVRDGAPLEVNKVGGVTDALTNMITPGAFPILLEGSCDQTLGDVRVEGLEESPHFVNCVNNTWSIEKIVNSHVVISQKDETRKFTKYRTNAVYEVSPTFCDGAHCFNNVLTANFVCQEKHGPGATFVSGTAVGIDSVPPDPFEINSRIGSDDPLYGDEFEFQKGADGDDEASDIDGCENCTASNALKSLPCTVTTANMN